MTYSFANITAFRVSNAPAVETRYRHRLKKFVTME